MSNPQAPGPDPRYAQLVRQYGPQASVPVHRAVIEYAHAPEKRRGATVLQFILGMLAPIAYAIMAGVTLAAVESEPELFAVLAWVHPVVFIAGVIFIRMRYKMRAFLAGVLTTVLGAPLGLGVVCAIICSAL